MTSTLSDVRLILPESTVLNVTMDELRQSFKLSNDFYKKTVAQRFIDCASWFIWFHCPWVSEALRGYWWTVFRIGMYLIPVSCLICGAALVNSDHETASQVIHSFFSGLGRGFFISLKILPMIALISTIAINARVTQVPVWVGSIAGFFGAGYIPITFVGDTSGMSSWVSLGVVGGAVLGAVCAIVARGPVETLLESVDSAMKDKKWTALINGDTILILPWGIAGAPVGAFVGCLWGVAAFLFGRIGFGPAANWFSPSAQLCFAGIGTAVGLACAGLFTPNEFFFGRWSLDRLSQEGKIVDVDCKPWKRSLLGLALDPERIVEIDLSRTEVRSRDLEELFLRGSGLPKLKKLSLNGCRIDDRVLMRLRGAAELESLDLDWTDARGDWLGEELPKLRFLSLIGAKLNKRVEYLGWYPTLAFVDLKMVRAPKKSVESLVMQRRDVHFARDRSIF